MQTQAQRKLTRLDAAELSFFFRNDRDSGVTYIKAQNYAAFATFSTEMGGEVDRDGAIVRRIDADAAREEQEDFSARIGRVLAIGRLMFEAGGGRHWRTLEHAFKAPKRGLSRAVAPPRYATEVFGSPARRLRDDRRVVDRDVKPENLSGGDDPGFALFDQFQAIFRSKPIARIVPWTEAARARGRRDCLREIARRAAKCNCRFEEGAGDCTHITADRMWILKDAYRAALDAGLEGLAVAEAVLRADEAFKDHPYGDELDAAVLAALDLATRADERDDEFLEEVRNQARADFEAAGEAWRAAREMLDRPTRWPAYRVAVESSPLLADAAE